MSYGVETVTVHKNLKLDKRASSQNWYARLTLVDGKRIVKSMKTDDLNEAIVRALELFYETRARLKNNLPAQTRKFKHVAEFAIKRMQEELEKGSGKLTYKDYIAALRVWLIPYFEATDIAKIDLSALTAFDSWRTQKNGKPFSQSGINNHNSALNRVLDEAELHGWLVKSLRPTLLNKGTKSQSRGSFTEAEYKRIHLLLRSWHKNTKSKKAAATRELLRNYVLVLGNTGIRHGTESLGLQWKNIVWIKSGDEFFLMLNVDGKTGKRGVVARDVVGDYLYRQSKLNSALDYDSFEDLVSAKSDAYVFVTRLGETATIFSLNRAFNSLLDELDLKIGSDGKTRTLGSLRHYYTTRELKRGVSTHILSRQLGNSTLVIDNHYSKITSEMHAYFHSGRDMIKTPDANPKIDTSDLYGIVFEALAAGTLDEATLLVVVGAGNDDYAVTDEIKIKAMTAKRDDLISQDTLMRLLNE